MDNRAEIRGDPVELKTDIYLTTNFEDMGARWVMFSVRNITWDGSNPVEITINGFYTAHGSIITTREEYRSHQVDLWVDVLDIPVRTPITIEFTVGSSQRGGFMMESMVIAFDRGYEALTDASGAGVSLFASTHLGVNEATNSGGGLLSRIPAVPAMVVVAVTLLALALPFRRDAP